MSDEIANAIKLLVEDGAEVTYTAREKLNAGMISEDEYFIEYGKVREQIRIIDAVMNSDLDEATKTEVRKIIKED